MAQFSNLTLTNKGLALQAKAQTGTQLVFTRVGFGDGQLASGDNILNLTDLKNQKITSNIASNEIIGDGTTRIRAVLTNTGLSAGFYLREVGVFATDPDEGEILYAYSNAGNYPDFLPAGTGNTIVETTVSLITIIGNASNVTATIPSGIYITTQDFQERNAEVDSQLASITQQTSDLEDNKADRIEVDSLTTDLISEKTQRQIEIAIERSRIDTFTSLAEGSTTGDAELIDSRVAADGIIFPNLGNSIRKQVINLEEGILNGEKPISLILSLGSLNSAGDENTTSNRCRTGFIYVGVGKKITINPNSGYKVGYYYYDNSKVYQSNFTWITSKTTITTTQPYIRFIFGDSADATITTGRLSEFENAVKITFNFVNAELEDARVDSDGTSYNSLKEHVSSKIAKKNFYNIDIGDLIPNAYLVDGVAITNSYSGSDFVTDFIPVYPNKEITLEHIALSVDRCISYYNQNKKYVANIQKGGYTNDTTITIDIPSDCAYIRFGVYTGKTAIATYTGTNLPNISNDPIIIQDMQNLSEVIFKNFLKTSGHIPLVTWIDDDTIPNAIPNVKAICDNLGIKCTFACITDYLLTQSGLKDTLLDYQQQGFHITSHSNTHGNAWKPTDPSYSVSDNESDLITSLKILNENGFLDSDYFVSPYGTHTDAIQKMVKKWCNCLVISGSVRANHLYDYGKYSIQRVFIDVSAHDLNYYKSIIDNAYDNGDWLVFGTHSGISSQWDSSLVNQVMSYVLEKGIEVMTLNQAMKQRKSVYDIGEMFS